MKFKFESAIIFEDSHFMVVNKPPFMATLADRNTLQNLQLMAKKYNPHLSACHRLDKETSGCMLFAKDKEAYRHAALQFEQRRVHKIYHAFVEGIHTFSEELIDLPITTLRKGNVRIDRVAGKPSKTTVSTLELFKRHSLVECIPKTGRMHQIRIHMAQKGAPLINDTLYNGRELFLSQLKKRFNLKKNTEEQPLIKRFALHARALSFETFNNRVRVEADYPKDLAVLAKQLRKTQL